MDRMVHVLANSGLLVVLRLVVFLGGGGEWVRAGNLCT